MRTICAIATVIVVLGTNVFSNSVLATPILAVDFGRNIGNDPGTPSPVQPGFNGMAGNFPLGPDSPPPSLSAVFDSFTVTVSGDPHTNDTYHRVGFEDTAASAAAIDPSIRAFFEDAMINNLDTDVGRGLNLSIQGVTPRRIHAQIVVLQCGKRVLCHANPVWSPRGLQYIGHERVGAAVCNAVADVVGRLQHDDLGQVHNQHARYSCREHRQFRRHGDERI